MDSFISVAGWTQHAGSPSSRPFGHLRSLSSITGRSSSPKGNHRPAGKAPSTSDIPTMPATFPPSPEPAANVPLPPDSDAGADAGELSTLPDPRSGTATPTRPMDLNDEIATLSTKLINAINRQTTLDDTLATTRLELEAARKQIRDLEDRNAQQREMLAGDVWVRRDAIAYEKKELKNKAAEERRLRLEAEKEKKRIEAELESLTSELFTEANKMVIQAKEDAQKEQEAMARKHDQLRAQLADTEGLLKSQQEQLAELKLVMEHMTEDRDDSALGTTPSSPGFSKFESKDDERSFSESAATSPHVNPISPTHPMSFTHLIQPVLRTDLSLYDDLTALLKTSRRRSGTRTSSGSISGIGPLATIIGGSTSSAHPSNTSTASFTTAPSPAASSPQTPNTPASHTNHAAPSSPAASAPSPLKESKFYKRVLTEDIEPTLRLDLAPGLSWLARRSVLTAMAEGNIVVEPVPVVAKPASQRLTPPCALCGESRNDASHERTHRFRTSESDSAQRYSLCGYCLGRVRSTCDFLGFLRILRDGHWRADDEESERAAWEESVRLREQMFWARMGGGVVPAGQVAAADEFARRSHEEARKPEAEETAAKTEAPAAETAPAQEPTVPAADSATAPTTLPEVETPSTDGDEQFQTPPASNRNSLLVSESPAADKEAKRLSITISAGPVE